MTTLRNQACVLFVLCVLASMASAQQINVGTEGVLQAGETVKVEYVDASRAGETVTITISNGEVGPFREEVDVEVQLDASGKGATEWGVNSQWEFVEFTAPDAQMVSRAIGQRRRSAAFLGDPVT